MCGLIDFGSVMLDVMVMGTELARATAKGPPGCGRAHVDRPSPATPGEPS